MYRGGPYNRSGRLTMSCWQGRGLRRTRVFAPRNVLCRCACAARTSGACAPFGVYVEIQVVAAHASHVRLCGNNLVQGTFIRKLTTRPTRPTHQPAKPTNPTNPPTRQPTNQPTRQPASQPNQASSHAPSHASTHPATHWTLPLQRFRPQAWICPFGFVHSCISAFARHICDGAPDEGFGCRK